MCFSALAASADCSDLMDSRFSLHFAWPAAVDKCRDASSPALRQAWEVSLHSLASVRDDDVDAAWLPWSSVAEVELLRPNAYAFGPVPSGVPLGALEEGRCAYVRVDWKVGLLAASDAPAILVDIVPFMASSFRVSHVGCGASSRTGGPYRVAEIPPGLIGFPTGLMILCPSSMTSSGRSSSSLGNRVS